MHNFKDKLIGKSILDMGCGTAILAIAAEKMGAKSILAIDNDEWAYENSIENIQKNKCSLIETQLGDAGILKGLNFDIVLANINRNILCRDMVYFKEVLNKNGFIFLSGFFTTDIPQILEVCQALKLSLVSQISDNSWACLVFES